MHQSQLQPEANKFHVGNGEDASHSLYCTASTALEAVMQMSESVMRSRLRYGGGWNYKPERPQVAN